jgi:hypothetical protein
MPNEKHGKHYHLYWTSKVPSHLKYSNFIPSDTELNFNYSKVVPSYGFSSKEVAESFLCLKKKGLVILTDLKTGKIVQAIKWEGSSSRNPKTCQKYFPKRKSPSRSNKRRRSNKRKSYKRS